MNNPESLRQINKKPRWHLAYFFLAFFDLATICGSIYLSHKLLEIHAHSVAENEAWAAKLDRFSEIRDLASKVNAPGNDVFDTLDPQTESQKQSVALAAFQRQLSQLHADILAAAAPAEQSKINGSFERIQLAMNEMTNEANQIFTFFQKKDSLSAGQRMATMDRKFAVLSTNIAEAAANVRLIQSRLFQHQLATAQQLRQVEYLFGAMVTLIIFGVAVYGHAMTRQMKIYIDTIEEGGRALQNSNQLLQENAIRLEEEKARAEASERIKTEFLTNMSHELRTPMTGVLGMAELLQESVLDNDQRQYLHSLTRSAQTMVTLLNDILDLAKIEAGKLVLESIPFEPADVCQNVLSLLNPRASSKGLFLTFIVHGDPDLAVFGDPTRFQQILFNLVGNALKFTDAGGVTVQLTLEQVSGSIALKLAVRDTGVGIAEEALERIFEKFEQADKTTTRKFGGTGLGLSITRKLVEAMGGILTVSSKLSEGSVFSFETILPPAKIETKMPESGRLAESAHRSLRILVAEDNDVNRTLVAKMLSKWGHRVHTVENGQKAYDAAQEGGYDLILMDMQMPEMDGAQATRAIRQLKSPANKVRIIALTADAIVEHKEQYMASGLDGYLTKPVAWAQLKAMLDDMANPKNTAVIAELAQSY